MKRVGDLTVNDGNGLFDNEGLCDSLIADCNNAVKHLCSGQYLQFCGQMIQITKKLTNLKTGIRNDMQALVNKVEELKRMNDELAEQVYGLPVKKDGGGND